MNRDRLIDHFIESVKIHSESGNEKNFAEFVIRDLKALGFDVMIDNAGEKSFSNTGNIIAKIKGTLPVTPIFFCAHMDTVKPGIHVNPIIKDDIIYSDGSTILGGDDKAGISAILEALRHIRENDIPHGDIEVIFTICEEVGLLGSTNLNTSFIASKMGFILDSSGDVGTVIVQGPAQTKIHAIIKGRAAHAGLSPELGISAIQVAAKAITDMKLLRIDEETTANIGTIQGGIATNIVCETLEMKLEARSLIKEKLDIQTKHMVDCINDACKEFSATCDVNVELCYPEFKVDKDNQILKITESAMKNIGVAYKPTSTGGGSDTNIFNNNGLQAVTLGIGMSNCHSTSEYISIENLVKSAELVVALIQEMK